MSVLRAVLAFTSIHSKQDLIKVVSGLVSDQLLRPSVLTTVDNFSQAEILAAVEDTVGGDFPEDAQNLRLEEFKALQYAAVHGAPPAPSSRPGDPHQFEVVQADVRTIEGDKGQKLRVTPVNRLRVVMVQTGYRRLDPINPVVDCAYDFGSRNWYPGVELFGEGIFIDLAPTNGNYEKHFSLSGEHYYAWLEAWMEPENYLSQFAMEDQHQLHPVFVWWHTLAHRLINALSIDSGYSSAAVRERVYIDVDEDSGEARGGILLYTVQPGGDGTLGGLVALVPQLERVLQAGLWNIDACSNDPLCGEEKLVAGKYNGAACYACALISETSCEHRNMRLDRNLLLENLP